MIYRVVLDDLYDLHTSDINCMLLNPSLELEMNSAGSFNFTLPPKHPSWDRIEILKSTIDVYEDDDLIFTGRVANIDKNWNNERVVECEGALAYFNDSIHRQMKWETPLPIASEDPNVHNFLKDILDNHNVFVGDATNRQIHVGHIYVDPYLVTREVNYDTTLDILTRMCIDTNGGYFMIRKDPETHLLYLDWLKDFTEESGQPASFGVNLLDFNTGLHAADICTGVLARGATVNDQVVTLSNVELVDETTYPDLDVDHYTTHDQDILWHRNGVDTFGRVVQVHDFPDAQTDWKNDGQIVGNSLFEEAKKWLEEKNTKVESIEVEVAELSWLKDGVPKYKLGQIVQILDDAHMAGEPYDVRLLPMYKLSCDLSSGSKKVTLGRPPKKELTQISASNSDSSTLSSGNSSGSSSGGGSGSGEECKVHDVRVDGTSVVSNKIANISLAGKADVSTVNALAATVANKANTSTVNALANVVSGKQDQIEFNTLEAATEVLTRLKADNVVYNLGGGTEVEANPSESATDDLETIKIGNTVYDISSSGGGSFSKDMMTLLWTNPQPTSAFSAQTVSLDLSLYNLIGIEYYTNTSNSTSTVMQIAHKGIVCRINHNDGGNQQTISRGAECTDNGVIFENGLVPGIRFDSTLVIPYKIYGIQTKASVINNPVYLSDYYSEEEQVVGRWTDGKPLYQKTYIFSSSIVINNQGVSIASYIDNLSEYDMVVDAIGYGIGISSTWCDRIYLDSTGRAWCAEGMTAYRATVQYTKTTDAPGTGPTKGNLIYLPALYSEEEREVGVWTDGKPLYQKVADVSVPSGNLNTWINHNISGLTNATIVDYNYDILYPAEPSIGRNGYAIGGYEMQVCRLTSTNFYIIAGSGWNTGNIKIRFIIRYTKTTDQPGSGKYLPEGQLAHHYSTSEKIVGTWIDGSTLYEKTFNVGAISAGNDVRVSAQLNIAKVIRLSGNAHSSNYNQWVDINFPHQNISAYIVTAQYLASSQEINIHTGTDFTLDECYVTLQYTKTS